jgi:hypothetical protein
LTASFTFGLSDQAWAAKPTSTGDASFTPKYDSVFGRGDAGGSLTATTRAGAVSQRADGTWVFSNTWISMMGNATPRSIMAVVASVDSYVDSFNGCVSEMHFSMDLADAAGNVSGSLVPATRDRTAASWVTSTGPALYVPTTLQSPSAKISFVLTAGTDGIGGATWHFDTIRFVIYYL